MKYKNNTKWDRNAAIVKMRKEHPELAMQEIANEFGISKARVSQIVIREAKRGK